MKDCQHCSVVCMQTDRQIYGECNIHFLPLIRNYTKSIQQNSQLFQYTGCW